MNLQSYLGKKVKGFQQSADYLKIEFEGGETLTLTADQVSRVSYRTDRENGVRVSRPVLKLS